MIRSDDLLSVGGSAKDSFKEILDIHDISVLLTSEQELVLSFLLLLLLARLQVFVDFFLYDIYKSQ